MRNKILLVRTIGPKDRLTSKVKSIFPRTEFFQTWEECNTIISQLTEETIYIVSSDSLPSKAWAQQMETLLKKFPIVTGDLKFTTKNADERVYAQIFSGRTKKAVEALGYALPWATLENLCTTKSTWQEVGPFSSVAGWCTERDWSWRAILQGKKIGYCKQPLAMERALENASATNKTQEFFDRGADDAWLQRTYQFLSGDSHWTLPLAMGIEGFERLWQKGNALRAKWAFAYGSGMQWGYSQPLRSCPLKREAKLVVDWKRGKGIDVFVPGKGLTSLEGKVAKFYELSRAEKDLTKLEKEFQKLFRVPGNVAKEEVSLFLSSLST